MCNFLETKQILDMYVCQLGVAPKSRKHTFCYVLSTQIIVGNCIFSHSLAKLTNMVQDQKVVKPTPPSRGGLWSQKGAKWMPKWAKGSLKTYLAEQGRKSDEKGKSTPNFWKPFWSKSIKIRFQKISKRRSPNNMEFIPHWCQHGAQIDAHALEIQRNVGFARSDREQEIHQTDIQNEI